MKASILFLLLFVTYSSFAQKLEKIWSSPAVLKTPESVLFNKEFNTVFIANMGGESDKNDGDGFIAQMNLKGEITNLNWVSGLNDPKGMALWKGKLYVADKNELVVIDIKTAKVDHKYLAENAKFLNDVTVSDKGVIYVSDMKDQAIYSFSNGEFKMWLQNNKLPWVNGLWAEGNKLYAGNNSVWEIDIASKEMKELFNETGGVDGLETIGNGNFIFSNWGGKIYVSDHGKVVKLIDNSEAKGHTADLDYIPESYMVLVPTFFENNVDAYKLIW
ncbi:MAG: hypothetical protein ACERKD_20900 [Prolixibacteraceae bacterium]